MPKVSLLLFFALLSSIFSPLFSGSQSDICEVDDGGDNGECGLDIFGVPILFPYADYHKGRKIIRLRPRGIPMAVIPLDPPLLAQMQGQAQGDDLSSFDPPPLAPFIATPVEPMLDKYNRRIITLDHGNSSDPHLVRDHGILNLGLLAGVSFTDPDSYVVQYNALMKLFYTSGTWAERITKDHHEAKNLKKYKVPTKPKHFDHWQNGDDLEISGNMAVAIYAGVSVYISDVRAGGILIGKWHKKIKKLDEDLVRISFTRSGAGGVTARIQALPLTKIEGTALKDWDGSLVYTFDRSTEKGRKALKNALNNKIFVYQKPDQDNVTLLTERKTSNKKISRNLQVGVPFIVRARASWHKVKLSQHTYKHRNKDKEKLASKGYLKQKAYRHINLPKTNKHKKWKHFTYTNFHYNKIAEGTARVIKNKESKAVKRSMLNLSMEIEFSHDKVKVEKVNKYNKKIGSRVGFNDFVIDTGYKKSKQIGYVGIKYQLNVGTSALNEIINKAHENKHLFDTISNELITTYFKDKNDPHSICRGKLTHRGLCIGLVKLNTKRKLNKIAADLRKLHKHKIIKSKSSSSTLLAKIARRLRTNQFVLQSFIATLPANPQGYGTYALEGELFYGQKFIVDPGNQRMIIGDAYEPKNGLFFNRNDALLRDEDYDMI